MSIISSIFDILVFGLGLVEGYIDDPKRRLEARLKAKESMRLQIMELIKEGKTGEEADKLALTMLDIISRL
ncbi:MAG: hypothetical protein KKB31_07440 [Nanoarchaeota archaeon]|nr:hypothetical protein [Nanoarchaeota archaeon]